MILVTPALLEVRLYGISWEELMKFWRVWAAWSGFISMVRWTNSHEIRVTPNSLSSRTSPFYQRHGSWSRRLSHQSRICQNPRVTTLVVLLLPTSLLLDPALLPTGHVTTYWRMVQHVYRRKIQEHYHQPSPSSWIFLGRSCLGQYLPLLQLKANYTNQSQVSFVMLHVIIPYNILSFSLLRVFFTYAVCDAFWSLYLMLVFQVSHVNDEVTWPKPDKDQQMQDWAKLQIEASMDFAHGSWFTTFLVGSLNYQAVHHLFPHVSS